MTEELPGWLTVYAGLDDEALAALGNKGLVRRALREVSSGRLRLVSCSNDEVSVECAGTPPTTVRLRPPGPTAAHCPCPVAGACVHLLSACVWAREVALDGTDDASQSDPIADVLSWDPATVMRAAGAAAVRTVARRLPPDPAQAVAVDPSGSRVAVRWPGSEQVVVVAGAGLSGIVVAGSHSDAAVQAARLEAVVRVFATHGRDWPWPAETTETGIQTEQRAALDTALRTIESLVAGGLSRASDDFVERLRAVSQSARLVGLPSLASLAANAAGNIASMVDRADDIDERQVFSSLAQTWGLATALVTANADVLARLQGRNGSATATELGTLTCISARWWLAPSGARGVTAHLWDADAGRLETVTTGRAAGSDPSFSRSWSQPLLWGASMESLCGSPFRLDAPERRDDGSLSPTTRTKVVPVAEDLDLNALAVAVNDEGAGASAVGFGQQPERVRIHRLWRRFGLDRLAGQIGAIPLEIDEISQEVRWTIVDSDRTPHLLRIDAASLDLDTLTWLMADNERILAVVTSGDRPDAVFVDDEDGPRLVSLTLTPVQRWRVGATGERLRKRFGKLRERRAAAPLVAAQTGPFGGLTDAVGDVVGSLAATGRMSLTPRQVDAMRMRARECTDLGLGTLAAASERLLDGQIGPPDLLRIRVILDRVEILQSAR